MFMKSLSKVERKVHKSHILSKKSKVKAVPKLKEEQRQRASATKHKKGVNQNRYFR